MNEPLTCPNCVKNHMIETGRTFQVAENEYDIEHECACGHKELVRVETEPLRHMDEIEWRDFLRYHAGFSREEWL